MQVRSGNFGNAVTGLALAGVDAIERANLVGIRPSSMDRSTASVDLAAQL